MTKKELYKKVGAIEAEFNRIGGKLALEFEVDTQKYFDDSIQYWSDAEKSDLEIVFDLQKQLIKRYKLENKFDEDFEPIQNVKENVSSNKEMSELFTILDRKLKKGIYVSMQHNTIYGGFYEFDKKIEKLNLSGGGTTCFQIFQEDKGTCCVMVEGIPDDPKLSDPYNKEFSVDDIKRIVDFIEDNLHDYIEDKLDSVQESKLLSFRQFVNESFTQDKNTYTVVSYCKGHWGITGDFSNCTEDEAIEKAKALDLRNDPQNKHLYHRAFIKNSTELEEFFKDEE